MTYKKLFLLHKHYQNNYDFQLKKVSYKDLHERIAEEEEWIVDSYF